MDRLGRTRAMKETAVCEITLSGMENQEWQGSVYFPNSGERRSFQSLLELIRVVERNRGASDPSRKGNEA